jgi:hypothetical protein
MQPIFRGLLLLAVLTLAPAAPGDEGVPPAEEVADLIGRAESARQEAAARSAEWLGTRALIEQAREAAAEGALQTAGALASEALQQSELALLQAEREAEAWRERVPR